MVLCFFDVEKTALGWIAVLASREGVRRICLPQKTQDAALKKLFAAPHGVDCLNLEPDRKKCFCAAEQLHSYFAGTSTGFDCSLDLSMHSAFDRSVWNYIREIPYGETGTYSGVAKGIGRPGAARAVGAALGRNPIPIIIPCHRIMLASGELGGFASGLEWKRRLLRLEEALPR